SVLFDSKDGLVKIKIEAELESYWDMWGDNPADLSDKEWAKEQESISHRLEVHGYWALCGYARASEDDCWTLVDNCGGFFGDDLEDNGYDTDIKRACLDWLDSTYQDAAD